METIQARMNIVFNSLNTNANAFGKKHGLNIPTIYNLVKGNRAPRFETLVEICNAEPSISAEYLIRGQGKPLRDLTTPSSTNAIDEVMRLQAILNQLFEGSISKLKQ